MYVELEMIEMRMDNARNGWSDITRRDETRRDGGREERRGGERKRAANQQSTRQFSQNSVGTTGTDRGSGELRLRLGLKKL